MSLISNRLEIERRMAARQERDDLIRRFFAMGMQVYQIAGRVGCSQTHVRRVIDDEKARLQSSALIDHKQQFAYTLNNLDLLWRETWESYLRSCDDELITENFEVLEMVESAESMNSVLGHNGGVKTLKRTARTREGGINHLRTLLEILRYKGKILGLESVDLSPDNLDDLVSNFDLYAGEMVAGLSGDSLDELEDPDEQIHAESGLNELQALIGGLV